MTTELTGDAEIADQDAAIPPKSDSVQILGAVSIVLSAMGFLTLLRLADRKDRAPASALGLFFRTSVTTLDGTVSGLVAASRTEDSKGPGKGLLLGATGAVLGILATVLNFNWMRTRRRI